MLHGIGSGIDLASLEAQARERLSEPAYRRIAAGSLDGLSLRRNIEAWQAISLAPRVLRGVGSATTGTSVLGTRIATPVIVAPAGLAAYSAHPEGEMAVARGAQAAGTLIAVSTYAAVTLEQAAEAAPGCPRWFQLYIQVDRGFSAELLQRAKAAGYGAIVLTVDAGDGMPGALAAMPVKPPMIRSDFEPALSLADIEWVKSRTGLPVVVKGVLRPDDARECVAAGADAIVVSNHGGRMMDTAVATARALPGVVRAVDGRAEVYVDGGIRRGHDVLKAIALGARAVLVGRPWIWGLAVAGSDGVRDVIARLTWELATTMQLCGVDSVDRIGNGLLWKEAE